MGLHGGALESAAARGERTLRENGPLDGGEQLLRRIRDLMAGASTESVFDPPADQLSRMAINGTTTINARDEALDMAIESEGRS